MPGSHLFWRAFQISAFILIAALQKYMVFPHSELRLDYPTATRPQPQPQPQVATATATATFLHNLSTKNFYVQPQRDRNRNRNRKLQPQQKPQPQSGVRCNTDWARNLCMLHRRWNVHNRHFKFELCCLISCSVFLAKVAVKVLRVRSSEYLSNCTF